ncbi:hypothetical protein [Veillonella caviae]|uniref:hypothetical protein n=1 Tax=Veillonella caviae TaxID=248316 RepID=UPI002A90DC6B|nr:hypothetical protein [Veillonella caviae]MDY6225375.1 hypothetical protein [Veillonella caviae]
MSLFSMSIGSLRYGVRLVRHGPGSAFVPGSTLNLSAHCDTVYRSGGRNASSSAAVHVNVSGDML